MLLTENQLFGSLAGSDLQVSILCLSYFITTVILRSRTSISTTVTFLVHIDPKIGNMQSYDERLMNKDRSNFFDYLGNLYFGTYLQTMNFKSSLNLLAHGI